MSEKASFLSNVTLDRRSLNPHLTAGLTRSVGRLMSELGFPAHQSYGNEEGVTSFRADLLQVIGPDDARGMLAYRYEVDACLPPPSKPRTNRRSITLVTNRALFHATVSADTNTQEIGPEGMKLLEKQYETSADYTQSSLRRLLGGELLSPNRALWELGVSLDAFVRTVGHTGVQPVALNKIA